MCGMCCITKCRVIWSPIIKRRGRAGRDGAPAECILLYSGQDVRVHKYLIEQGHLESQREQVELRKLQSMIDYCFCSTCLRKYMLAYFGEIVPWLECSNCSSCNTKGNVLNVNERGKGIFRAIIATEERYGASMIRPSCAENGLTALREQVLMHYPYLGIYRM